MDLQGKILLTQLPSLYRIARSHSMERIATASHLSSSGLSLMGWVASRKLASSFEGQISLFLNVLFLPQIPLIKHLIFIIYVTLPYMKLCYFNHNF